jgi:acyl carrier protein
LSVTNNLEEFILELGSVEKETIDPDEDLLEQGLIDSLAIVQIIAYIEDSFGVSLGPNDVVPENFATINALAGLVESRANQA